jgi:hypothetical protein
MKLNFDLLKQELVLDKVIDFVLIFVGLYAAIAVQKWQDGAKEKAEYNKLLGDFKAELHANQERKRDIEKGLGASGVRGPGKVLGPLQAVFDDYLSSAAEATKVFGCLEPLLPRTPGQRGARMVMSPGMKKECQRVFASAEQASAGDDEETFQPVDLAPRYRSEVHQVYLANGIKVFENKNLAVKIGEAYTMAREIERGMADIEQRFNDGFMQKAGEQEALTAQIDEALSPDSLKRQPEQARARLTRVMEELQTQRFVVVEIHKVLEAKVTRIKDMVARMDGHLAAVVSEINAELARLN